VFHVIDKDNNSSNDSLGQCLVELKHLNPELGLHGNFELSDLVGVVSVILCCECKHICLRKLILSLFYILPIFTELFAKQTQPCKSLGLCQ